MDEETEEFIKELKELREIAISEGLFSEDDNIFLGVINNLQNSMGGAAMNNYYPRAWENIDKNTSRLKVPGGWIVNTVNYNDGCCSESTCFVPDPGHQWVLEPEK